MSKYGGRGCLEELCIILVIVITMLVIFNYFADTPEPACKIDYTNSRGQTICLD